MKKLSTKHLIVIIIAAVLLISTLAITFSLTMCRYEEPDLSKYGEQFGEEVQSPYGMYDYSKRAFLTGTPYSASVYKGDVYYINAWLQFTRIPLNSITAHDLRVESEMIMPETYSICPNVTHNHNTMATSADCPNFISYTTAKFLIDAYESAGDYPIIYFYSSDNVDYSGTQAEWDSSATYEIYRYDTGKVVKECLVSLNDPPRQMMTYDQSLYFVTQSAENEYKLNKIAKKGGKVTTVSEGVGELTFLGVHNEAVIFKDGDATIYKADLDLQSIEEIYQVSEDLELSWNADGYESLFIHGDYLYFWSDYRAVSYNLFADQNTDLLSHSIRRISLDDPHGDGELVVENVLDTSVHGIVDNVLYYSPCEPGETLEGYYYNFNGGLIRGVNLDSLQTVEMKEDCGLYFFGANTVMSGNAVISYLYATKPGYSAKLSGGFYVCLFDFKSGAVYPLYTTG